MDVNGNGYLSLAEIDKGLRDVLRLDSIFSCKRAIMRAFQAAKNAAKTKSKHGADYVERIEFRLLLQYLRQYFEYYQGINFKSAKQMHSRNNILLAVMLSSVEQR